MIEHQDEITDRELQEQYEKEIEKAILMLEEEVE